MKRLFCAFVVLLSAVVFVAAQSESLSIIPLPASVERGVGTFALNGNTRIVAKQKGAKRNAEILAAALKRDLGLLLKITSSKSEANYIEFVDAEDGAAPGNYSIDVTLSGAKITGDELGGFYAIQSLIQLLPIGPTQNPTLPVVAIKDHPRFGYRGMHLDVGRHFMPVEFVKKYIDLMSQFKFNYFHWHLTDDQGWRIEIKKYPRLTEIGSKRPETMRDRNFSPYVGDGIPVEGFYTQKQAKEIIAYAKARHITVIPEIELPGHASAALAAYPEFGCKADYKYKVQTTWGIFKEVYCPTDATFKFLEDVIGEVIDLFPDSPYIHIGGDEVLKDHWKESPFVQDLMKRENLKDEHEVQSYFVHRIEKFINSKGKKMIGWDEILEGGVAPNATIMSWRGEKGGIEAAKAHHDVIMTPNTYVYFDYGQGDPAYEPLNIGGYLPLERVYSWNPVPKEIAPDEAKYIIGGQANIWTEYLKKAENVEYMAFPRMLALAEVLWSPQESRNFEDFKRRLNAILPRLDKQNVNYRIPEPDGLHNVVTENASVSIELHPAPGTRVLYTTDGSTPGDSSLVYSKPIEVSLNDGEVKTFKTIVINAVGRKSVVYTATIVRGEMQAEETLTGSKPGVAFELNVPGDETKNRSGDTRSILLTQFEKQIDLKQPFGVQYDGYFKVPADGVYEFQIDSTWDTTLLLGGKKVIDDAGTKDHKVRSVIVPLKAGLHKISLRYNHHGGDSTFRFRWGLKGQGLRQAYGGEFVH